jgi:hypothetical protein
MAGELDREAFLRLLEGLGSASDEETLAAAREIHAQVGGAGVTWDQLLVPVEQPKAEAEEDEEQPEAEAEEDEEQPEAEAEDDEEQPEAEAEDDEEEDRDEAPPTPDPPDVKDAEALKLIARLLDKSGLLEETRAELREYKKDIAAGEFDATDRRYLKALHARLAKRK